MHLTEKDLKRFWAKVGLPDGNGCMPWLASKLQNGYGQFSVKAKYVSPHRLSLFLATGEMPDGLHAAHAPVICHTRSCVAPGHLRWATRKQNKADQALDRTDPCGERNGYSKLTEPMVLEKALDRTDPCGERNGYSKLTEPMVLEIRAVYAGGGVTQKALGDRYGVHVVHINRIVNKRTWSWLT